MTDRELLELAAKAANLDYANGFIVETGEPWNPLTDDGDALRLVVKLGMALNITPSKIFAGNGYTGHTEVMDAADPYAATRRAIVRTAAEIARSNERQIGKEMK
jgi:hypothetical protein